jgi:hypothetical protein
MEEDEKVAAEIYELRRWGDIEPGDVVFWLGRRWITGDSIRLPLSRPSPDGHVRWALNSPGDVRSHGHCPPAEFEFEVTEAVPRRIGAKAR